MNNSTLPQEVQVLLDKQALHELNTRYARGSDRSDLDLLQSAFHADATIDVGAFVGSAQDFCVAVTTINPGMDRSAHMITNEFFSVDGDTATGESYVFAITKILVDGKKIDQFVNGRYVDRFSKRDGEWRIDHRLFIIDSNATMDDSEDSTGPLFGPMTHGIHSTEDASYSIFKV